MRSPLLRSCVAMVLGMLAGSGQGQEVRDRDGGVFGADVRGFSPGYRRPAPSHRRFTLGVEVRNLETGVQVVRVIRDSPAERAGIDRGDVILTVGGYQVGYVNNRLYDLGDEVAARIDGQGRALLLVQQGQSGRLANTVVDLYGGGSGGGGFPQIIIEGTVSVPPNLPVGRGGWVTLRILDVTHANWKDVVISSHTLPGVTRFPAPFQIELDASQLDPRHRYAIDAQLFDQTSRFVSRPEMLGDLRDGRVRVRLTVDNRQPRVNPSTWYQQYLGRPPTQREEAAWLEHLQRGYTPEDIEAQILGSSEAYERRRNDPAVLARDAARAAGAQSLDADRLRRYTEELSRPGVSRGDVIKRMLEEIRQAN